MVNNFSSLKEKISFALAQNRPFTAYRKPSFNKIKFIGQNNNTLNYLSEYSEKGFVFAPFNSNEKTIIFPLNKSSFNDFLIDDSIYEDTIIKADFSFITLESDKKQHIKLVSDGIEFINNYETQKIVLSRKETFAKPDFNCADTFINLLKNYQTAFVYIWFHPKVGLWLGATPETLLQVKNNNFKTMALAGTQEYTNTINVVWKNKEQEEQKFVTDFIFSNLKKLAINCQSTEPYTVKAGSVLHLRSDITGVILHKKQLSLIIETLHPTPAVCGLPKEEAKQFILANENYNRKYYTGFLGELNFEFSRKNNRKNIENHAYQLNNNITNLYVNLRCMQVVNDEINLYLGGGITKDSNPESEFMETVIKSKTIKKCL